MKTFDPSGRMKSALFGSRPSAKKATFTPAPVASAWACGVLESEKAVWVVWSASGSSSGLLGSDGHVPATGVPLGAVGPAALRATVRVLAGFGSRITASGTTLATALLALSLAASAFDMRAEKPFSTVY